MTFDVNTSRSFGIAHAIWLMTISESKIHIHRILRCLGTFNTLEARNLRVNIHFTFQSFALMYKFPTLLGYEAADWCWFEPFITLASAANDCHVGAHFVFPLSRSWACWAMDFRCSSCGCIFPHEDASRWSFAVAFCERQYSSCSHLCHSLARNAVGGESHAKL